MAEYEKCLRRCSKLRVLSSEKEILMSSPPGFWSDCTNYYSDACLPLLVPREVLIVGGRVGEGEGSELKCPLSGAISVQKNTEVTDRAGEATKVSILGMGLHAWSMWWMGVIHAFLLAIAIE